MRRILMLLTVMALMVAMLMVMVAPAFAATHQGLQGFENSPAGTESNVNTFRQCEGPPAAHASNTGISNTATC